MLVLAIHTVRGQSLGAREKERNHSPRWKRAPECCRGLCTQMSAGFFRRHWNWWLKRRTAAGECACSHHLIQGLQCDSSSDTPQPVYVCVCVCVCVPICAFLCICMYACVCIQYVHVHSSYAWTEADGEIHLSRRNCSCGAVLVSVP